MTPIIHFQCPGCESAIEMPPAAGERVRCPHCQAEIDMFTDDSMLKQSIVQVCAVCGHDTLYIQKDFNRNVGVAIVGLGILLSVYFLARSQPIFAMGSLGLTALVDFLLY